MPQHLALNTNFITGTSYLTNQKQIKVTFTEAFDLVPAIQITLGDEAVAPPYKVNVSTTSFTIKFQNNFTGYLDWTAIGRK
jgi:hypothetical protein